MNRTLKPEPIRTSAENEFAHRTMTHRLPRNIRNVIEAHPNYPASVKRGLEELAAEMEANAPIPPIPYPAWDGEEWERAWAVREGEPWQDTEWFFGETYGFRLLLSVVRYFETFIDPYGPMKERELKAGSPFLPVTRFFGAEGPGAALLEERSLELEVAAIIEDALHLSMWGNRADISFHAGGEMDHSAGDRELLLSDQGGEAAALLASNGKGVHIVMDNSGAEMAGDLVLALTVNKLTGAPVTMHLKFYPTYVSDTIVADVHTYLDAGGAHSEEVVRWFAREVQAALDEGRILLAPDPYWCETEFLSSMPPRIGRALSGGALTIVKGDFNYRRAFRDTIWPADLPLADAMGLPEGTAAARSMSDTPWLFLRTMKSDVLVGVERAQADRLDAEEPGWRTDGRRGVIQFLP
ncbi:MAG: ARMT1-like domain-containing protein [Spirochaetaceae bacterium]